MTRDELVVFGLALWLGAALVWLLFRAVPVFLATRFTEQMDHLLDRVDAMAARYPSARPDGELLTTVRMLDHAIREPRTIGISVALTVMTLEPPAGLRRPLRDDLSPEDRQDLGDYVDQAVLLVMDRAFLGSTLWFLAWPLTLRSRSRARSRRRMRPQVHMGLTTLEELETLAEVSVFHHVGSGRL